MVINPLFEKPAINSLSVIIPVAINIVAALNRINPGRMASRIKAIDMKRSTAITIQDSNVIILILNEELVFYLLL